jgi:hypothetical protein
VLLLCTPNDSQRCALSIMWPAGTDIGTAASEVYTSASAVAPEEGPYLIEAASLTASVDDLPYSVGGDDNSTTKAPSRMLLQGEWTAATACALMCP